jgi:hypothetical protein
MTHRYRRIMVAAVAGFAGTTTLVGCGSSGQQPAVQPSEAPPPTRLSIVVTDGGTQRWTLTCGPDGGTHPHPDQACAALARAGASALKPVPAEQVCTQIYGGPQAATITGTWRGTDVKATLRRTNGCEIARWSQLAGLLPAVP